MDKMIDKKEKWAIGLVLIVCLILWSGSVFWVRGIGLEGRASAIEAFFFSIWSDWIVDKLYTFSEKNLDISGKSYV